MQFACVVYVWLPTTLLAAVAADGGLLTVSSLRFAVVLVVALVLIPVDAAAASRAVS